MRTVHSLDELLILPRDRVVNGFRARSEIRLEIPDVTRTALTRAQDALNALQERRGALAGSALMLVALVLGVIDVTQRHVSLLSLRAALELVVVLGAAFALGFAARFTSCAITRWQFARRCREQHRVLADELMRPMAL
jgi:hypothetical protein